MKNKRYKRIAKRLKGHCIGKALDTQWYSCISCDLCKTCMKYTGIDLYPYRMSIRTLENLIKNN